MQKVEVNTRDTPKGQNSNSAPNRVEIGWTIVLDATRLILAKYEPVAWHGHPFYHICVCVCV